MKAVRLVCWLAVIMAVPLSCYHRAHRDAFKSNFSEVRIAGGRIVVVIDGSPYSGTLVARDREITAVAHMVLDGTPLEHVGAFDPTGLILVLPVNHGVPSGRATLHADLRSPRMTKHITERGELRALLVARAGIETVELAEATFKHGKLDGVAAIFEPGGAARGGKLAEAELRDNRLHGPAVEYFPGTSRRKRELRFEHGKRSGPARWFYPDGALEREVTFAGDVLHGEVTEYYANGSKRVRGTYHRGRATDTWEAWFPTGQRESETVYGVEEQVTEWYSNGELKRRADRKNEVRYPPDGLIIEYHSNGAVHSRTHYVAGVKHGPFEVFYANGRKWEAGQFDNGKQQGPHTKWWNNGQLALESTWVGGARHGSYRRWYAQGGAWETATYEMGKLTGRYQKWWKNGAVAHDYAYKDGKIDGDYRTWYDNGKPWAVGLYAQGKPQGTLQRWFPDGKLGYIMHHKNGRPDGPYKRWYANGKPRLEAHHVNGQLDGELKNWLEDGSVYELATFQRGLKIRTTLRQPGAGGD